VFCGGVSSDFGSGKDKRMGVPVSYRHFHHR
jgi:hypothetical protein